MKSWTYEFPTLYFLRFGRSYRGRVKAENRNDARGEVKRLLRMTDRLPTDVVIRETMHKNDLWKLGAHCSDREIPQELGLLRIEIAFIQDQTKHFFDNEGWLKHEASMESLFSLFAHLLLAIYRLRIRRASKDLRFTHLDEKIANEMVRDNFFRIFNLFGANVTLPWNGRHVIIKGNPTT